MNRLEKKLVNKFKQIPSGVTPGFVLQVYQKGQLKANMQWGKTWTYYDLASLTKILFTTPMLIKAVGDKKLRLKDQISKYLPWAKNQSIHDILNHTAGNRAHVPFYKKIDRDLPVEGRRAQVAKWIRSAKIHNQKNSVYSDLGFLQLGFLLESVYEQSWLSLWEGLQQDFICDDDLFFSPDNKPLKKKNLYGPTERCPWRKRVLQGEVHDDNTWAMGGVAPHAGLFGTVTAVSKLGLKFRQLHKGKDLFLHSKTFQKFARRSLPSHRGDWGLGFMLPTQGGSSCGQYFSNTSYGHIGFTGTTLWIDPKRDVLVTLLSNRVHPKRNNPHFGKWRPQIHDWVIENLSN